MKTITLEQIEAEAEAGIHDAAAATAAIQRLRGTR